ncbi:unnamed protein product [Ostreobium quekettii]|uniref:Cyclic nucleotide-binding domain-containing protein n=1 Tax=Ostreobium quekettii TaxID=121088 RepID=A0A8S1JC01_9CHLO|nr:unnamed protein product [Ostreobium quekettii]
MEKLGLGEKKTSTSWEMAESGEWVKECSTGAYFGEKAVLHDGVSMVATLLALEVSTLAILDRPDYQHIKAHGFDGELKKKVDVLSSMGIIQSVVTKTDLRSFAYVVRLEKKSPKCRLCEEGKVATTLSIIIEGTCKVTKKMTRPIPMVSVPRELVPGVDPFYGTEGLRSRHHRPVRSKSARVMDVAVLGKGDLCGEVGHSVPR